MRQLNKIVYINTANKSLKYAEVNLDGNVHFIGTQGVGKSTLLRTILFFYNADKQKLGIKSGQQNYDQYYYPYQNSYIVYEVKAERGAFCVMTFKSQGRVAFRFIDSAYHKHFFIDSHGKALESWDKIRETLGRDIYATRIVSSYEEYRNIIYGNNKGLQSEFRKYALIESKQYQNIPRTISNVFLNTKLDAVFVKETIIKSINEDEIKIDLSTYLHTHLRDFEAHLNDIKKWTDTHKTGVNLLEKQADKVAEYYSGLLYLNTEREQLALQLGWAMNALNTQRPKLEELQASEKLKQKKLLQKVEVLVAVFDKEKADIIKQVGIYSDKLKTLKTKRREYEVLDIDMIIRRVAERPSLELRAKNLSVEREVLSSKFLEIQKRYDVLIAQLNNQLVEYTNNKQTEINAANARFTDLKEGFNSQFDAIVERIHKQHGEELNVAKALVKAKERSIGNEKIKRAELKNKKLYEQEIEQITKEIQRLKAMGTQAESDIGQAKASIANLKKEWQLNEDSLNAVTERNVALRNEQQASLRNQISAIDSKIDNSKDSLYGWLDENMPDWASTIGKVIDQDHVLFMPGLNPQKVADSQLSFYGVSIDTHEIGKELKTVSDLQAEKIEFNRQIELIQQDITKIKAQQSDGLEKFRKKFHIKIKELKELIQRAEYSKDQSKSKMEAASVGLSEWEAKAAADKQISLQAIEKEIAWLTEQKLQAEDELEKLEGSINRLIATKRREKTASIKAEQSVLDMHVLKHKQDIRNEKVNSNRKSQQLKQEQDNEMQHEGADTKRIAEIELELAEIRDGLGFIESNRDKVAEYNKDKRELFDKEIEFKSNKSLFEKQLSTENEKFEQQRVKLNTELDGIRTQIDYIETELAKFKSDVESYDSFVKTALFVEVEQFVRSYTDLDKSDWSSSKLILALQTNENSYTKRYVDLQESINTFAGNFGENNLFSFKLKFINRADYFAFADMLKEFIDENKIAEYRQRFESRFASIIKQIGIETNQLLEKEGEISKVVKEINNDFVARNFVGAIKSMELKTDKSANVIFQLLVDIAHFNDSNPHDLGELNLFSTNNQTNKNSQAIELLKDLIKSLSGYKEKEITLSDTFELQFKIVENDNDTGWVDKLSNVGSEGTDTLAKAMINIMLLNVFKEKADRKNKGDFRLHCMMDEIGKLHPSNVKGILKFANERNIMLINSSPTSYNAADYRYTYLLAKDDANSTIVRQIVSKRS